MTGVWLKRRSAWGQQNDDARDGFDVDYGRVVHSGSFRRLQGKTQILNLGDSDFYRTRLTHSLEVAQIAGGLKRQLAKNYPDHKAVRYLPPLSLIQTSGFCHDLGHPPFGHGGEVALNYCMRNAGGFEGNGQTLRILSRLENFSQKHGADLTRRSLLAILKYPVLFSKVSNADITPKMDDMATSIRTLDRSSCKPPKCFFDAESDVVEWILNPMSPNDRTQFQEFDGAPGKHEKARHKSFDCSIMDQSDDIAYPFMTCGPRIKISPGSPGGSCRPVSSMMQISVDGIGTPTDRASSSIGAWVPNGVKAAGAAVSVIPYVGKMTTPSAASMSRRKAGGIGAPPV